MDSSPEWVAAVNGCPFCGAAMPERTEEHYKLASSGMGGAWSQEFERITTGFWFSEHCACGEFLTGVEYQPEFVCVESRPEQYNDELVFDRWVVWYGRGARAWS